MFFRNKKKEPEHPAAEGLHAVMYDTVLNLLKTALSQPNQTITPEELAEKLCPAGFFSEEERAQLLQEALGK
ncbi:MAG: hypothetical protein IKQ39_02065 [Oscillospiraceae bacterium]|nr:hypothetical protein [Oscillospiraceae bacterium]